jgi:hypothetical protein
MPNLRLNKLLHRIESRSARRRIPPVLHQAANRRSQIHGAAKIATTTATTAMIQPKTTIVKLSNRPNS